MATDIGVTTYDETLVKEEGPLPLVRLFVVDGLIGWWVGIDKEFNWWFFGLLPPMGEKIMDHCTPNIGPLDYLKSVPQHVACFFGCKGHTSLVPLPLAAKELNVSDNEVRMLIEQQRLPGAWDHGWDWLIPSPIIVLPESPSTTSTDGRKIEGSSGEMGRSEAAWHGTL